MKMEQKLRVLAVLFGTIAFSVRLAAAQQGTGSDGAGQEILQKTCTGCHELNRMTQAKKSAAQWEETVADMVRRGAPLIESERQTLLQVLVKNYGTNDSRPASNDTPALQAANRPQMASRPQETAADAKGREVAQQACSVCHQLEFLYSARRSRAEWEGTVNDMIGRGAPLIGEEERQLLLQFLAKYYGPENQKTNINNASTQELMSSFGLSQAEAAEIARFRQQNGAIHGWEDLRKIPNLDLNKLEAKRNVLAFL